MTVEQRADAERYRDTLAAGLEAGDNDQRDARAVVLTRMFLAYPSAHVTVESSTARSGAYRDALDDVPAWAIGEAVRRWNRGECGAQNYNFAPAPAILRSIAVELLAPWRLNLERVNAILDAVTLDRAMDSTPIDRPAIVPMLRRV